MNRRGFFGVLASVAATATLDPERLLWVRGQKLISIPAEWASEWARRQKYDKFSNYFFAEMLPQMVVGWQDGDPMQSRVLYELVPSRLGLSVNTPLTGGTAVTSEILNRGGFRRTLETR